MADNTQTIVTQDGLRRYEVVLTNISDGTGEANATKVDMGQLTVFDPRTNKDVAVSKLAVEGIEWAITGFTSVELHWETDEDNYIAVLPGGGRDTNGDLAGTSEGKLYYGDHGLVDDSGQGGSVQLTTRGNVDGDTYMIRLCLRKKT